MNCKHRYFPLFLALCLVLAQLCGCQSTVPESSEDTADISGESALLLDAAAMFTDRDKETGYDETTAIAIRLSANGINCTDASVAVGAQSATISAEGCYIVSGALSDGQIIVDAPKDAKLQIVLDNVELTSNSSAPLYVKSADKVFVTLAPESRNTLSTASEYTAIDDNNIDATIFSKSDLTINGSGSLAVSSACGHGIVSKDDLVITGGTYEVTAARHALSGKDSVRILDGTLVLNAGKDGIHSENTDDMEKGFIYVAGGNIQIDCESDGFDGDNTVQIEGGNIQIAAGDDGVHSDSDLRINGGLLTVSKSYEGLEGMTITITDGEITVVSEDDGLNAAGAGKGQETDSADEQNAPDMPDAQNPSDMPDGQNPPDMPDAQNPPDMSDGQNPPDMSDGQNPSDMPDAQNPPDMPDAQNPPDMPDAQNPSDMSDAQNPSDMSDAQNPPDMSEGESRPSRPEMSDKWEHHRRMDDSNNDDAPAAPNDNESGIMTMANGGDMLTGSDDENSSPSIRKGFGKGNHFGIGGGFDEGTEYNHIQINGGTITIDAGGDGIDSNGNLTITGGTIYVYGSTSSRDAALDYAGNGTITGGTVIALGASGMAMNFGADSTQGSMLVTVTPSLLSGELSLTDADGTCLISCSPPKPYNSVLISCAELTIGETYALHTGDMTTDVSMDRLICGESDLNFSGRH